MASPDIATTNEFQQPFIGVDTVAIPNKNRSSRVLRYFAPLLAVVAAASCTVIESLSPGEEPSDESIPALTTTPTTISVPTTELAPTTEPTPTTILETTTSIASTETTEVQVNINNKALCEQARDDQTFPADGLYGRAGVPNRDSLVFHGNCTGLPGDLNYGWVYPGESEYVIPSLNTAGFEYNAKGYHYSELPVGGGGIPLDKEHPEYEQYGALTLRELASLEPGSPICVYLGTEVSYADNRILGKVGLATFYNKYSATEPNTYVGVFFLNPDGTEDPTPGSAASMGVMDFDFGGSSFLWTAEGKCKAVPQAV